MQHETEKNKSIDITEGIYTFSDIPNLPYSPKDMIDTIKDADILLMPYSKFRDGYEALFPEETVKFFDYLQDECKNKDLKVDICISDEDYKEIELHAEVINISNILVQWCAFPILTGIISCYLYDKMKHLNRKDIATNAKITVEKNGESKTVSYEGAIENFEQAMRSVDEHIFK